MDYKTSAGHKRLLARIHRRYVTSTQTVRIGRFSLPFTRIADPDRVLDQVAAEADRRERVSGTREADEHLHLPYWAELWDSAMGIAQFLVKREGVPGDFGSTTSARSTGNPEVAAAFGVLDLGCGMGLSGTIAAALGASVLFADLEPPALLFARLNSLDWGKKVRTRRLNWRTDRLAERFSLILGADILYERAQWEYLDTFWGHHLALGGAVLLGEPGRQTGDLFIQWVCERAWKLQIFEEKVPTRERPVRIFELART